MTASVAAYVRVSTDEQAEHGVSIPAQKSRLLSYCQAYGWDLLDYYVDDGYSGKSLDRPAMQRLIKDAEKKKFDSVLVLKLDRLSRRQKDVLHLLEDVFEPSGIGFKSVTESFDTTTPFGKAALGMMAVFAQLERETIVERVKIAKKETAKMGCFMGGIAPYGYKNNTSKKTIEIDENEAVVVKFIFDEYLKGDKGYQAIGEMLNMKKIPTKKLKLNWDRSTVKQILTNPVYIGKIKHKGTFYTGKHAPIIETDKWNQVQDLLSSRDKYRPTAGSGLISSFVFCGECGAKMRTKNVWQNYPHTNPKRILRYYICYSQDGSTPRMIRDKNCDCGYKRADTIDNYIVEELMKYSFNPTLAKKAAQEILNTQKANLSPKMEAQLQKEIHSISSKIERWYAVFENGSIDPDELVRRLKELREKKLLLEEELQCHITTRLSFEKQKLSLQQLQESLKHFPLIWQKATVEEQHQIITNLIKAVKIYKDDRIEIEFI